MAQQGFDPTFGLRGTCASRVSGYGGWPLALTVGVDGRPTVVCSAPDQRPADRTIKLASRFRAPPVWTIRIVSFPPDGRPVGGSSKEIAVYRPNTDEDLVPARALARSNQIAVLGSVVRANRPLPTLMVFAPGAISGGVAPWSLVRASELTELAGVEAERCGLGLDDDGDVVVVVPELTFVRRTREWILRLVIVSAAGAPLRSADVSFGAGLDLPAGFEVSPRVGAVCADGNNGLFVALSFEGLDPQIVFRLVGVLDAARAAVVKLRRSPATPDALEPDPVFGHGGFWVTTAADGDVTTAELIELDAATGPIVAGRAISAGTSSLFAASLDAGSGTLNWSANPALGIATRPAGLAVESGARVLLCASTRERDLVPGGRRGEAVVVGLSSDGQPDASIGQSGLVRYRLFADTFAGDVHLTAAGEPLVASAVRWGRLAAVPAFHVCVSRLTPGGRLSQAFGSPGVCRHDGMGDATSVAVGPTGRVWSAGIVKQFVGIISSIFPWEEDKVEFKHLLSVSQLSVDGELDSGFGFGGIQTHELGTLLPPGEGYLELTSLVPLADGGAALSGNYLAQVVVNPSTNETDFQFRGSWVVRLEPDGKLDSGFGTGGLRKYAGKAFRLVSELDDGSLQGYDDLGPRDSVPLRMNANGTAASGFTNFVTPIPMSKSPVTMPTTVEPNGEWFAPIGGGGRAIGLVRCLPNGTIDAAFGAGPANPPSAAFVDIATIEGPTVFNAQWDQSSPHRTIRLGDGTLLTIWSFTQQVSVPSVPGGPSGSTEYPFAMVVIAWTATGLPRTVTAIPHPAASFRFTSWISWRSTCALLQPDGSILVGLMGDDTDALLTDTRPRRLRQSAYFCRLVPPGFGLDPNFGTNGVLVRRLPDDGYRPDHVWLDSQVPASLGLAGPNAVVAALSCVALRGPAISGTGTSGSSTASAEPVPMFSPNSPFDGSVGVARLT